jgi:hypothetical protein
MDALSHQADDCRETTEIIAFDREKWMFFEERDDATGQVTQTSHAEARHVLAMIVHTAIDRDCTTFEEAPQCVKHRHTPDPLDDRELRLALPAQATRSIPKDRDAEASLTVDEADDPLRS